MPILDEKSAGLKKGDMFDGDTAFTLYDTYGFPLDLTQDALKSRGISVDQASFTDAMEQQTRQGARVVVGLGRYCQRERLVPACAKNSAPPNFSATTPRAPKAWSPRW